MRGFRCDCGPAIDCTYPKCQEPQTIHDTVESLRQQRNDLLEAVDNLSKVKGRYNTEIAWSRMADLVAKLKATKEQGK